MRFRGSPLATRLVVTLIVASTATLVVGVLLERHVTAGERSETATQRTTEAGGETGERHSESGEAAGSAASGEQHRHAESSEKLLGVNPESTGLLVVAVVASLLLAAAVWWRGGSPIVLGVVALAMAAFCALDIRELVHQIDESRAGLAVLAAVVATLHLAAALVAARAAIAGRDGPPPVTPPAVAA